MSLKMHSRVASVLQCMLDWQWKTLTQISTETGYSSLTGLAACIRSLRKPENGSHVVEKRHLSESIWEYRLVK